MTLVFHLRAHQDLAADGAERLGLMPERLIQHHQLGRRLAGFFVCVRVLELLRQCLQDVFSIREAQRDGRLAEPKIVLALVSANAIQVVRRQIPRILNQLADRLRFRACFCRLSLADKEIRPLQLVTHACPLSGAARRRPETTRS